MNLHAHEQFFKLLGTRKQAVAVFIVSFTKLQLQLSCLASKYGLWIWTFRYIGIIRIESPWRAKTYKVADYGESVESEN